MAKYRSAYTGQQIDVAIDTVYNLADVATSGDYDDLINKPSIPSNIVTSVNNKTGDVTLTASDVSALPSSTVIPTKVSDLTNDSGFITTETDPTVPSWAKASTKPTYTAVEVGAVPASSSAVQGNLTGSIANTSSRINIASDNIDIGSSSVDLSNKNLVLTSSVTGHAGQTSSIVLKTISANNTTTNNITLSDGATTITGVVTPTSDTMAANKKYVDDSIAGITHPVTSVNNKTGAVVLTASDVGALPDTTKLAYQGSISISGTTATLTGIPINALYWSVRNNNGTGLNCIYVYKNGDDRDVYRVAAWNYSGGDVMFVLTCCSGSTVYRISTGVYSADSTSTSMTGTYSYKYIPSAAAVDDVTINGTSILSSGVANLVTNTAYDASSNKIATMSDVGRMTIRTWSGAAS